MALDPIEFGEQGPTQQRRLLEGVPVLSAAGVGIFGWLYMLVVGLSQPEAGHRASMVGIRVFAVLFGALWLAGSIRKNTRLRPGLSHSHPGWLVNRPQRVIMFLMGLTVMGVGLFGWGLH